MDPQIIAEYQKKFPEVFAFVEGILERFPELDRFIKSQGIVRDQIDAQAKEVLETVAKDMKPYRDKYETHARLPKDGVPREEVLKELKEMQNLEQKKWSEGYVSGAVYHGNEDHIEYMNTAYTLHSQSNPLHTDLWPSASKFEAEIISMTAGMLSEGAPESVREGICGSVSSGGTESILLAMKTYRDMAFEQRGVRNPEMVLPTTAHVAFHKAAQYFKIKMRLVPFDGTFRADMNEVRKAINHNTVVVIGSAPAFPHGIVDPIEEMSNLALQKNIPFHTDACLGGYILPWAKKLGYNVPKFDFSLPGVTSISVDTHKYGYAAKGTSVILYRNAKIRHHQFFTSTNWPGGMYFSPTFAGSRAGGLSAACWAALVSIGEKGYLEAAKKILKAADYVKAEIQKIPELKLLGDPLYVIAFASDTIDIYKVMEQMTHKGYSLNGLHRPACVHIALTLRHAEPGVPERFIEDLKTAVAYVKANPSEKGSSAPIYGMAASLPVRSVVGDLLKTYMDAYYKV
ncbi:MAG: aminotransferase class V-fold PLP-dependent enzyme [Spirochaetes bacterium]|nr:aminotransferase class V-fold PLP-dependent enzyme [Spirochaetota bacterium]